MPRYDGFPPDEVEDLKTVCVDALFSAPAAIAGTRAFARAIMRAGWRRRAQVRLRVFGEATGGAGGGPDVVAGWLEVLDAAGIVEWSFRVPPMPADECERLSAAVAGRATAPLPRGR